MRTVRWQMAKLLKHCHWAFAIEAVYFISLCASFARLDPELAQLSGVDERRRPRHQIDRLGGLWKRDDFANRLLAGQNRDDPIEPQSDAAVRRRAVFERVDEEAEPELRLLIRHAQQLENETLQPLIVDPEAAAADLAAVQH